MCQGTVSQLKSTFGCGFQLSIQTNSRHTNHQLLETNIKKFYPDMEKLQRQSDSNDLTMKEERTFVLPVNEFEENSPEKFDRLSHLFEMLENKGR